MPVDVTMVLPVSGDAVRFTAVEKRFGATAALAGLSFDVAKGEMFGLIGPDGAGKTTAIRLLCGLLHPDAGSVRVLGADPAREHGLITERVGYLSQRFTPLRRPDHRREHRVLRRDPRRARLSGRAASSCSR